MRQPSGFVDPQFPSHVCRLQRSLYGLKQAPRAWFQCFSHHLEELGFQASMADSSLFIFFNGTTVIYLPIYVDDILVTGNNPSRISTLIQQLGQKFSMKDLGPLHYFWGMEITRTQTAMYLTQSKYILDLLKRTKMADAKPLSTPALPGRKLSLYEGEPLDDGTNFRSVVGALQYLLFTRPDIAFAVNQVCQYMHSPTTTHWAAVKRILRYLKATHDRGIVYKPGSLSLTAFADADYAGDLDDRRSTGVASNPVYQARMRHVEVDYHYVREKVTRNELVVGYVSSADQIADLLTKGLSTTRFSYLISKLPVRQRPLSLRGRDKPNIQYLSPRQQCMEKDSPSQLHKLNTFQTLQQIERDHNSSLSPTPV
ncbi:hypothetical protein TB1_026177 [Malus domestica]